MVEGNAAGTRKPHALESLRTGRFWNAVVMFVGSCMAELASFALSVDGLILARQPEGRLGCDVNGRLSCSSVSRSWQANLIHMWGTDVPNALFGTMAFGVFIGFTAALMFGYRPARYVRALFATGVIACVMFAGWLLLASVVSIRVLCPWCLTMDGGVCLMAIGFVRWLSACRRDGGGDGDGMHGDGGGLSGSPVSLIIEAIPFLLIAMLASFTFFMY